MAASADGNKRRKTDAVQPQRMYVVRWTYVSYFEVNVVALTPEAAEQSMQLGRFTITPCVSIGLAPSFFPLIGNQVGWRPLTYGLHSDDGNFFAEGKEKKLTPSVGAGDTIGCGFDHRTNALFFTINGELFDPHHFVHRELSGLLHFTIGLDAPDHDIVFNDGVRPLRFEVTSEECVQWYRDTCVNNSSKEALEQLKENPAIDQLLRTVNERRNFIRQAAQRHAGAVDENRMTHLLSTLFQYGLVGMQGMGMEDDVDDDEDSDENEEYYNGFLAPPIIDVFSDDELDLPSDWEVMSEPERDASEDERIERGAMSE